MNGNQASPRALRQIVIVGGGTSGWMAAIQLNRIARPLGCAVTLVESAGIGTIGVGEATIPTLVHFIRTLRLDEQEFMRRCSATFKYGIRFDDWVEKSHTYWHPFGICGSRIDNLDLFHFWMKRKQAGGKFQYADHSLHVGLCEQDKAAWAWDATSAVWKQGSYAYHLDAAALADYLKEISTREGVQHVFGDVRHVALDESGAIASLDIGVGRNLEGDLFVDATGFSGLLIEKTMGDPWIDWSNQMLCDKAVAMPTPRSENFPPYTLSTALTAGWSWRIPLSSRTGNGYVFSSAHCSTDEAIATLLERVDLKRARAADPRVINIRVGRRTNFWVRNCVSIGLSGGFVEPLESTGIHLIQKAVRLLGEYLPDRDFNPALAKTFNSRMADVMDEVRDFILLHYVVTRRTEPFWRDSRAVPLPDSLRDLLDLYDETGRIQSARQQLFHDANYFFILAGAGRLPRRLIPEAESARQPEVWQMLEGVRAENGRFVERMPSHAAYLSKLHRIEI